MAAVPKELKFLLFGRGPKFHGRVSMVLEALGLACLIVGIISGFMDKALGLGATNWFLITIALWIWALWSWLCAYTAAKEG
jgi:hypothetical protein